MKHFANLLFGATLAATTTAAVAFAPSSAQANGLQPISLSGTLTINGDVNLTSLNGGNQISIDFRDVDNITSVPLFSNFTLPLSQGTGTNALLPISVGDGAIIDIKDLTIDRISGTSYQTTSVVTSFLDFGQRTLNGVTSNLSFDLNPAQFTASVFGNGGVAVTIQRATGKWIFDGEDIGTAFISGTEIGTTGSYTIAAEAVPEPITMGGLALGAGFGAYLKSRYSKKDEQLEKV